MEFEEDRLSSLPKIILHHILSKLPEKDGARTSVLSKTWLDTWYTFPILSFSGNEILVMSPQPMERMLIEYRLIKKLLMFRYYVKRRLLMFRDQSLAIKKFKINVTSFVLSCMSKDVDIWLKLACECGVEVIEYSQQVLVGQEQYHVLPTSVFEAKSLTKLVLEGFIKFDPIFMNYSIKLFSLRVLSLRNVLLGDEHAINQIISLCPLLEYVTLESCYVLSFGGGTQELMKSISISGLQKLKSVDVSGIKYVSIDASSLENICYYLGNKIDFDRCRNLKELYLRSVESTFLTNKWFLELFPNFPFLESLKLNNCEIPDRIDISSVRLKRLGFSRCFNLKEVNIDAQNLLSFEYYGIGVSKPTISFLRNSNQLEVNIRIVVDYEDLCNLREFVQNIQPNNVLTSLSLSIGRRRSNVEALDLVALQVSSSPPRIKHLVINYVPLKEYLFSSLVNIILSSCCPETISLRFHSVLCGKPFTKFFYETLMRKNDDECSFSSNDIKCWWHSLKDVKVTSSLKIDDKADFKTILESLPILAPQESISFRLEF